MRAIAVFALDESAAIMVRERLGFHPFDPADDDNLDLYLVTGEIEAPLRLVKQDLQAS